MISTEPEIPGADGLRWRREAASLGSIAMMLRHALEFYGVESYRVAFLAADIYGEKITLDDIQTLWKWKIGEREHGFDDAEIDMLLTHLYRDAGNAQS